MSDYLKYLNLIKYPEYADEDEKNGHLSMALLDLSFDDGRRINERVFGIVEKSKGVASKYTQSQSPELIGLISEYLSINPGNVLITAGSDGALSVASRALIQEGTKVGIPLPSFGRFEYHTKINKGSINYLEPHDFPFDIDIVELAEYCNKNNIEVVYLANPNNPTGIFKAIDKIEWFLNNYEGYLILDEALADYTGYSASFLVSKYKKLVIARTFSKLFGLAGMRVGYLVASEEIIQSLRVLVSPFEVSSLSILLAIEMLKQKNVIINEKMDDLRKSLKLVWKYKSNNLMLSPTQTSTFLIKSTLKKDLFDSLLSNNIRSVSGDYFRGLGNENCVRVSLKNYGLAQKLFQSLPAVESFLTK